MLRSYDPQTGRFIENDPYNQFASGYVGMGNDPLNLVDPTGGFVGPGFGCAATAGMSGYGGKVISAISSISPWVGITMNAISLTSQGISIGQSIGSHQKNANQVKSTSNSTSDQSQEDVPGPNNKPCNCPPGYSSTPQSIKDIFTIPFYATEYDVVAHYSLGVKDIVGTEYSALIYYNLVKLKNGSSVKMFSITSLNTIPGKSRLSPGPDALKHLLPKGAVPIAHIHNHYKGLGPENKSFSGIDFPIPNSDNDRQNGLLSDKYRWKNINYWVLGSTGYLSKYFADNTPGEYGLESGDAGQIRQYKKGDNFYTNPPSAPPCPCYKIK